MADPLAPVHAPYRGYAPRLYGLLRELNDSMSQRATQDSLPWLLDMLAICVRGEALITAHGLCQYLWLHKQRMTQAQMLSFAPFALDIFMAYGEHEEARTFLLEIIDLVPKDPRLSTLFPTLFLSPEEFTDSAILLPDGKLNAFYVSPLAHNVPGSLFSYYFKHPDAFADHPAFYLLLANAARGRSAPTWLKFWNMFLEHTSRPSLRSVDFASDNIFSTITFGSVKPILGRPTVTVIMAGSNCADTVAYSIRSILDQTFQNLELLFCDDGSTDDTLNIVSNIKDPRLRVFRSPQSQGPYNIRNHLISLATGEFITFQDADDLAFPDRIEISLATMLERDAAAVVGRWLRLRPNGEVLFFRDNESVRLSVVSLMARREFFASMGPYRSSVAGADSEIYERARAVLGPNAVVQLEKPLILGLWSSSSLTQLEGLQALHDGYRGVARRGYAELTFRQRILGTQVVPHELLEDELEVLGLARKSVPVTPLTDREVGSSERVLA